MGKGLHAALRAKRSLIQQPGQPRSCYKGLMARVQYCSPRAGFPAAHLGTLFQAART